MNTVLIVDDSKTSRYMLRHILVENGYEVIERKTRLKLATLSLEG